MAENPAEVVAESVVQRCKMVVDEADIHYSAQTLHHFAQAVVSLGAFGQKAVVVVAVLEIAGIAAAAAEVLVVVAAAVA